MNGVDVPVTALIASDPGFVKVAVLAVASAAVVVGGVVWWWLGRHRAEHDRPWSCCGSCEALDGLDEDDRAEVDDLMDLADAVFDDEMPTPVNEARPGRWTRANNSPNGAWFDRVSQVSNAQNARWISGRQQEQLGSTLADEAAEFLAAEAARQERRETTGEIRRGDPGE